MAATLQFVNSIGASPTVRLDINDGTIWLLEADGTDFSPPGLKTATADIILNDGATRSASSYENRRLKLHLSLKATSEDDKATKLRALQFELNRVCNIIKYQPGTTPLFFRTLRSPEYDLNETSTYALTYVTLDIEAEPFAYGLRVDSASLTVTNNPAAGTNPQYVDITGVTGDVATPALIRFKNTSSVSAKTGYVAARVHGTPGNQTWFTQAETFNLTNDTVIAGANDAALSGAGANYARTSFATFTTYVQRLDRTTFPYATAGTTAQRAELAGTYRVLAHVRKSVNSDVINIGFSVAGVQSTAVTLPTSGTGPWLVDLGLTSIPFGVDAPPAEGYSGAAIGVVESGIIFLASRTSGTGTLDWDYFLLLPADEALTAVTWPGLGAYDYVLDGPNDKAYVEDPTTGELGSNGGLLQTISRAGSIPYLVPAQTNRIFVLPQIQPGSGLADSIATTVPVVVSYWPRYLTV